MSKTTRKRVARGKVVAVAPIKSTEVDTCNIPVTKSTEAAFNHVRVNLQCFFDESYTPDQVLRWLVGEGERFLRTNPVRAGERASRNKRTINNACDAIDDVRKAVERIRESLEVRRFKTAIPIVMRLVAQARNELERAQLYLEKANSRLPP
jgi:hypothetical protein